MRNDRDPVRSRRNAILVATMLAATVGMGVATAAEFSLVKAGMVVALALLLAARATTGITLLTPDPSLDDELTRANRAKAARAGLWTALVFLAAVALFGPRLGDPAHVIALAVLVLAAAAAGIRFALLEARLD